MIGVLENGTFLMPMCKCLTNNGSTISLAHSPNKYGVSRKQILVSNIPDIPDSNSNYRSEWTRGIWGNGQLMGPLNYL